jgi:hypothetical protein
MQILEDETEYLLVIEDQRRKRPNAPETSKRKHFERANQKRGRRDFEWHPPQQQSPHKNHPGNSEKNQRGGHQEERNSERFTWTAPDTEPHVEPPRSSEAKPLVLTPQTVKKIADQRLKEWSKDQKEYAEQQFQEVQKRKQEQKEPRKQVAVELGPKKPLIREIIEEEEAETLDQQKEDLRINRILDDQDEEARLRHERKLKAKREPDPAMKEEARRLLEQYLGETEKERKSRRDKEWLTARSQTQGVWNREVLDPLEKRRDQLKKEREDAGLTSI